MEQPDYIVYQPATPTVGGARPNGASDKTYPLSEGLWQQETLDTLQMYGDKTRFTPVDARQMTLFPMDEVQAPPKLKETSQARDPESLIPHWGSLKFFSEDTLRFARKIRDLYFPGAAPLKPGERISEIPAPGLDQQIHDPARTEIKADHFPGRIIYKDGGLYPPNDLKAQEQAPNYRKVPGKPIHGVGQPTRQGFQDVLNHLDGKDKPIVWANARAEAIIYIEGKPHNLRALGSMENLDLKEGASAAELEAGEQKLKEQLLARGSVTLTEEVPKLDENGQQVKVGGRPQFTSRTREVKLTEENCQTTQDVVEGLKADGYKLEYRRIPLTDEKSPGPAGVESLRGFLNEMNEKYRGQDAQFVFNCHQGKGRTTTSMVTAGITQDGRGARQLELPFDETRERTERNIRDNAHLQNLNTTVDEYKKKSNDAGARARELEQQATAESDATKKAELERQAERAKSDQAKYHENAQEFTKRYALLQKYSEYVTHYGSQAKEPSFEAWMKESAQVVDLQAKWTSLNDSLGLSGFMPQTAVA